MPRKRKTLKRIDSPNGRAYALIGERAEDVKFLPSVTTVLSLKESSYLAELQQVIPEDDLKRITERAALRGTAMHKFLENYMICLKNKGDYDTCLLYTQRKSTDELLHEMNKERVDKGRSLFYNVYHSGLFDKIKKVIFTEQFLYSEKYLYAGTADFGFLDQNNYIVITDFKSASSPRTEDVVDKFKCQAAAYTIAFEEVYGKPVQRGEIWISHADGLQIEEVAGKEMEEKKEEFLDLCSTFHSMWETETFEEIYKSDI
jgi:hypothetical protein